MSLYGNLLPIMSIGLAVSVVLPLLKLEKLHERIIMIILGIICGWLIK